MAVASTNQNTVPSENGTLLCIGKRFDISSPVVWNANISANYSKYPWQIIDSGDAPGQYITSSIALPSDYDSGSGTSSGSVTSWMAFVSCNTTLNPSANDVYRIYDYSNFPVSRLYVAGSIGANISSVAYYGTSKRVNCSREVLTQVPPLPSFSVNVWRTSIDNTVSSPPQWIPANQPPSGPGNAQVAWSNSGAVAFCGTGQDSRKRPR